MGENYFDVSAAAYEEGDFFCCQTIDGIRKVRDEELPYFELEYPCHSITEIRWFKIRVSLIHVEDVRYLCIFHERFVGETELKVSQNRLSLATDVAKIGIWEFQLESNYMVWNDWMHEIYGTTPDDFLSKYFSWRDRVHPEDYEKAASELSRALSKNDAYNAEFRIIRPTGEIRYVNAMARIEQTRDGRPKKLTGVTVDLTDNRIAEKKIEKLAYYDELTGLPNRTQIVERLEEATKQCDKTDCYGAVIFIDLDNFKTINDTAGHHVGDQLLQGVAGRLKNSVANEDFLARLGGDEFIIILPDVGSSEASAVDNAEKICSRMLAKMKEPFRLTKSYQLTTASFGLTLFSDDKRSAEELMREADLAMYKAKEIGRSNIVFYQPSMKEAIDTKASLEKALTGVLERKELSLNFQPQIDDEKGVIGAEVLLRWQHPEFGAIAPDTFIPVAEETGLIVHIGEWILTSACKEMAGWIHSGLLPRNFTLSINISANQIFDDSFVDNVKKAVNDSGLYPQQIKLELTESLLVKDISRTVEKMNELKSFGISFSLDDFGTGFSSLSYLKQLPLSQLKIDKSFVRDILIDGNDFVIAKTIIALGNSMNLNVIAEGVESIEQQEALRELGCYTYQGYLYSKPLTSDDWVRFIKDKVSI